MEDSTRKDNEEPLVQRLSEATSEERLRDLEESEKDVGADSATPDPGPSPDGALDQPDEIKDAGPM